MLRSIVKNIVRRTAIVRSVPPTASQLEHLRLVFTTQRFFEPNHPLTGIGKTVEWNGRKVELVMECEKFFSEFFVYERMRLQSRLADTMIVLPDDVATLEAAGWARQPSLCIA